MRIVCIANPCPTLRSFKDRNPRVREEAINVVIKTMLTFPVQDLNVAAIMEYLAPALADSKQRVGWLGLAGLCHMTRIQLRDWLDCFPSEVILTKSQVSNAALEAITVLKERLSSRDVGIIYRAVEKMDMPDKRYLHAIKDRLDNGKIIF